MTLADDLLEQAAFLASREPRRPKQASLRRSISSSYYAFFHLLGDSVADQYTSRELRPFYRRSLEHKQMREVCQSFARGQIDATYRDIASLTVQAPLKYVAETFVDLQHARHAADYAVNETFSRVDARSRVNEVTRAFREWRSIPTGDAQRALFLMLLVVRGKR